jgi:hypothetical protein
MNVKLALVGLVAVSAIVRLLASTALGLGNDEAYHALYAAHPALSYFDHPPMMAWIEMAGLSLSGGAADPWALRIGFIALFAGSTLILARMTARHYGARAGFLAALALNLSGYYGLAASMFALPDGPLLFFWLLTLDRMTLALTAPEDTQTRRWLEVGLVWGGALLSKYHAVFLPMGAAAFMLLDSRGRRHLLRPGPYLAALIGLAVFSPVLFWNAGHDWASFRFQGGRAAGSWTLRPDFLALTLLAQAGYMFPWIWIPLIAVLVRGWRSWTSAATGPERLWLCVATVPLAAFTAVACFRSVLPHWGLIGLVPLLPMLGRGWADRLEQRPAAARRRLSAFAGLSLALVTLAVVEYRTGWLQRGGPGRIGLLDDRTDPTLDFYGWDQVAERIRQLGLVDDPGSFVFTRYWYQSAQLAHALGRTRPALCYNTDDARGFAFWSRPEDWVGHNGVLVLVGTDPEVIAKYFGRWFTRVEPAADFEVRRQGKPVRRIRVYRCSQQRVAFPFALDRGHPMWKTAFPGPPWERR